MFKTYLLLLFVQVVPVWCILLSKIISLLDILSTLLEENKVAEVKDKLSKLLPSYQSNAKIVDHLYDEQLNNKSDNKSKTIIKDQENKVISIKIK